jgi:hypothetical protein
MAVAVAVDPTITPNPIDKTQQEFIVDGTLVLSGNYGGASSHGDTMNLAGVCPSTSLPTKVDVYQRPTSGNAPVLFDFVYGQGTTQANGVLIVISKATAAELVEAAAYDAALTAATANIRFRAWFPVGI